VIKKDLTLKFSRIFVKIKYSSERFPDYLDFYNLLSLEGKGLSEGKNEPQEPYVFISIWCCEGAWGSILDSCQEIIVGL